MPRRQAREVITCFQCVHAIMHPLVAFDHRCRLTVHHNHFKPTLVAVCSLLSALDADFLGAGAHTPSRSPLASTHRYLFNQCR